MTAAALRGPRGHGSADQPCRRSGLTLFCGIVLACAVAAAGLLLAARRLSGGITAPLSVSGMAAAAALGLACTLLCDWLLAMTDSEQIRQPSRGLHVSPTGARLLARGGLAGFLWGASGAGGGPAVSLIAIAGVALGLLPLVDPRALLRPRGHRVMPSRRPTPSSVGDESLHGDDQREERETEADAACESVPEGIHAELLQRQVRTLTLHGGEAIRGTAVIRFDTGMRMAVVHVGFCPPFWRTPSLDLSTACDAAEIAVVAGELLAWGVRIEARLEEPAEEPFTIPVDFVATAPLSPS
jgi:hypothetical protein